MFVSGTGEADNSVELSPSQPTHRFDESHDAWLSPSIQRVIGERTGAFELKFLIKEGIACAVERWAAEKMQADAYADASRGGAYQTTTLYLDTPQLDVFHRSAGHRGRKFRLRRYGSDEQVHLERKIRRGDRVKKRRSHVPLHELPVLVAADPDAVWSGDWFRQLVTAKALRPACRVTYDRTAFVKLTDDGPLRLTLDRCIRGAATADWDLTPVEEGDVLLTEHVICEFKFRGALPNLFKDLIQDLQLDAGSVSKYRRTMQASGIAEDGSGRHV